MAKKKMNKAASKHLQYELISDLVEKIVNTADVREKVRWSWGVMKECEIVNFSKATKKHIEKCKSCQDFLNSRKALAELVIQRGRAQG